MNVSALMCTCGTCVNVVCAVHLCVPVMCMCVCMCVFVCVFSICGICVCVFNRLCEFCVWACMCEEDCL